MLKLPQSLVLLKARIYLLRVTIPADLYKSGILVEVEGINAQFETRLRETGSGVNSRSSRGQEPLPKGVHADRPISQSHIHDPGGPLAGWSTKIRKDDTGGKEDVSEKLPTTADLAQSFLQAEPQKEKRELEADIAHSSYFEQSPELGESENESSELGVGNSLSLPGFLADFLKGVGDRLQLKVKDVRLDLNIDFEFPLGSSARKPTDGSEAVTIRFSIEDLELQGVANIPSSLDQFGKDINATANTTAEPPRTLGQVIRRISMNRIQVMLVSDATLFANLSRFVIPSSPAATHTSLDRRTSSPTSQSISTSSNAAPGLTRSTETYVRDRPMNPSNLETSFVHTDSGRLAAFKYGDEIGEAPSPAYDSRLGESQYEDSVLADSFYSNSENEELAGSSTTLSKPHFGLRGFDGIENEKPFTHFSTEKHEQHVRVAYGSAKGTRAKPAPTSSLNLHAEESFGSRSGSRSSMAMIRGHDMFQGERPVNLSTGLEKLQSTSMPSDYEGDSLSSDSDDLTRSKIFSPEEAKSMYMSALSTVSARPGKSNALISSFGDFSTSDNEQLSLESPFQQGVEGRTFAPDSNPFQGSTTIELAQLSNNNEQTSMIDSNSTSANSSHTSSSSPTANSQATVQSRALRPAGSSSQGSGAGESAAESENPLIIMKRFFFIDTIVLKLPQDVSSPKDALETTGLNASKKESGRCAIGPPSSSNQSRIASEANHAKPHSRDDIKNNDLNTFKSEIANQPYFQPASVEIGDVEVLSDVALTKLTVMIIQQHLELLKFRSSAKNASEIAEPSPSHIKMSVKNITWRFLDLVKGFTTSNGEVEDSKPIPGPFDTNAETLLKASIDNLDLVILKNGFSTNTTLSLRKILFGYISENILSFDSGLKMRDSTRDILAPIDKDLILNITQNGGSSKVEITTLPMQVTFDLRRLDETFSWFGGFSSILGLGSSMMSTVTVINAKPGLLQSSKPLRGVHFETPASSRISQKGQNETPKITARVGGFVMILQGANCTLRLESSAMKLVSRTEGVGLQIDRLKFSGPYLSQNIDEPSIKVGLTNVRMEYLSTPKEVDLARLLALLSPSKDKYERDDDILLDTLLRQRRQGGVVRVTVEAIDSSISKLEHLQSLPDMAEELKKLSSVTKYLPEDDRPGILTLGLIRDLHCEVSVNSSVGKVSFVSTNFEMAHVTLPSLTALGISTIQVHRNRIEELVGDTLDQTLEHKRVSPMVMARFIGNEMEPTIKVKIQNIRVEYHVSTILSMMGLSDDVSIETVVTEMVSSIPIVKSRHRSTPKFSSQTSSKSEKSFNSSIFMRLDIAIQDSIIGLNPRDSPGRGLIVLTSAQFNGTRPKEDETSATLEINKASLMVIDDLKNIISASKSTRTLIRNDQSSMLQNILDSGFISISDISSAKATFNMVKLGSNGGECYDVEIRDDLLVLESCADSTQTLLAILNGLKPPLPPEKELKYRTQIIPVEDMLASLSGDAFAAPQGNEGNDHTSPLDLEEGDMVDDEVPQNLEFVSSFYNPHPESFHEGIANSMLEDELESLVSPPITREIGDKILLESFQEQYQVAAGNAPLEFREDHFGTSSTIGGTAHRWDIRQNTYGLANEFKIRASPLRLRVRDVHIIWNLFDGYDWQNTRDTISKAVAEVETKAAERLSRQDRRKSLETEEEEESVIGDFLFNSIYIGIPANRDPKDLARQINQNIDDLASETDTYAPSSISGSPSRQAHLPRAKGKRLRLARSKYHKMTFELKGVSADLVIFPPGIEETQSSIDIRVQDLDIFDHVPTSTWKKFVTYMHDAGERESGTSMIHLEIQNVKPIPELAASEIILKVVVFSLCILKANDRLGYRSSSTFTCRSRCSRFSNSFL